jgi:hypothetical protein
MAGVLSAPSTVGKRDATRLIRPRGRGIGVDVAGRLLLLLIGSALAAWCLIAGGRLNGPGAFFFLLYPWAVDRTGRLVVPRLGVEPVLARSFPFRFLVGFTVLALAQLLVHTLLPGSLAAHFLVLAAGVEVGWFVRRRRGACRAPERQAPAPAEMLLVVVCLLAATCWSRGLLVSVDVRGDRVIYRHWMDFPEHANIVARLLGGEGLWRMGNYALAGLPAPVYHYASYLPTATAAAFTGGTALVAVLSTWNPLGNVLIGLAAYTLVLPWAGRWGGLCATIAAVLLPDASYYWPANAVLRYHWLQQVGPAGLYGVSTAALSVVLLQQWSARRSRRALLGAWAFGILTVWFKAQIFAVLMPLLVLLAILWWPGAYPGRRLALAALAVALGVALAAALIHYRLTPDFGPSRAYLEEYNRTLSYDFPEGFCKRVFSATGQELGGVRYYTLSIAICALATLGVWLPLGALLLVASWRAPVRSYGALPCVVVLLYLSMYACLNDYALVGHNKWELTHRPFVWAYFVAASWCGARLYLALASRPRGRRLVRPATIALASVLLLPLPWRMGRCIQEGKTFWKASCANLAYPRGLVESGRWIARAGSRREIVQDGRYDENFLLGGLSERRSYLARPTTFLRDKSPKVRAEVERRKGRLEAMKASTTRGQLAAFARQTGIRWYVLHPGDVVAWPADVLDRPAFADRGFRVYDLRAVGRRPDAGLALAGDRAARADDVRLRRPL